VKIGAQRYIVTKQIGGAIVETKSQVQEPTNNRGHECIDGWLGSFTEGATTTDSYSHGLLSVLSVEPKFGGNHELDQPEEAPFGYEIYWG
jgi:hypothetical protein